MIVLRQASLLVELRAANAPSIVLGASPGLVVQLDRGQRGPQGIQGVQGVQGPVGPSGAVYEHEQLAPALTWTINHNLGFRPNVTARTIGGVEMMVETTHTSVNQVILSFLTPTAGTAHCS